jgi:UPF0755 protein
MPTWRASNGRGAPPGYGRGGGRPSGSGFRLPGFLRFILFAGILGGLVLLVLLTVLRPLVRAGVVGWAWDNPSSIVRFPFVGDLVREDLGAALTTPNSGPADESVFVVNPGDSIFTLAPRLQDGGYVADQHAFLYAALTGGLNEKLESGSFVLRGNMTPSQVADALLRAKVSYTSVKVTFREGLRIEQMTALLQTVDSQVDPKEFYDLAMHPPADLLAAYPWLQIPPGASLEGFLYPATYELITSTNSTAFKVTDARSLIGMLLDQFHTVVGDDRINVPADRGLTFYQVVALASIVEHEAAVDEERPLIAGVYQNRLSGLHGIAKILNADPTVTYAVDTMKLRALPFDQWQGYFFWKVPAGPLASVQVSKDLAGYQTYVHGGLIPGPISTPSLASIDAALHPNTATGYLYFVKIPDTKTHVFAKTLAEHNANLRKYGYL